MRTNKQSVVSDIASKLTVIGLSVKDSHRLAKRIVEGKIRKGDEDAVLQSVGECMASGADFAWRHVNAITFDVLFYGPKGWCIVDPIFQKVAAYDYEATKTSYRAMTGNHATFLYIRPTMQSIAA